MPHYAHGLQMSNPKFTSAARAPLCAGSIVMGAGAYRLLYPISIATSSTRLNLSDFLRTAQATTSRPFDIMLEAKAQDLALLRLREQVARFAPDLLSS